MSTHDREKVKLLQRLKETARATGRRERSLTPMRTAAATDAAGGGAGGINGLMGEVLETHIRFPLVDGVKEKIVPELAEDLIDPVCARTEVTVVRGQWIVVRDSCRKRGKKWSHSCHSFGRKSGRFGKREIDNREQGLGSRNRKNLTRTLAISVSAMECWCQSRFTFQIPYLLEMKYLRPTF